MATVTEHIATEALREILKLEHTNPAFRIAQKAVEAITELNKPTVHNLSAVGLDIDKPPGGGL